MKYSAHEHGADGGAGFGGHTHQPGQPVLRVSKQSDIRIHTVYKAAVLVVSAGIPITQVNFVALRVRFICKKYVNSIN